MIRRCHLSFQGSHFISALFIFHRDSHPKSNWKSSTKQASGFGLKIRGSESLFHGFLVETKKHVSGLVILDLLGKGGWKKKSHTKMLSQIVVKNGDLPW